MHVIRFFSLHFAGLRLVFREKELSYITLFSRHCQWHLGISLQHVDMLLGVLLLLAMISLLLLLLMMILLLPQEENPPRISQYASDYHLIFRIVAVAKQSYVFPYTVYTHTHQMTI